MKNRAKLLFVALGLSVVALGVFSVKLSLSQREIEKALHEAEASSAKADMPNIYRMSYAMTEDADGFVDAAENTVDAVVHIRTEIISRGNSYYDFFGSLLEQLYGSNSLQLPENVSVGYGSGVVVSPDGYIVTNNHVVEGANKIEVTFNDKHKRTATIIGTDPSTDLALIKVDGADCKYLTFADSDKVKVGEWVLAVGNPFNLTSTVTAGIVSAKARNINILGDGSTIESFIQTDAAINPGNSGGALVNMDGDLIGINAAIASRTGSYEGYSFAIPSNIVKKVIEDLLQYGSLQRAYLGVSIVEITEELASSKGIKEMSGIYVIGVDEKGGAKASGIKEGDIILSVNDMSVNSNSQLIGVISQYRPGDRVKVKIVRDDEVMEKEVVLRNRQGTEEMHKEGDSFYNEVLGVKLKTVPSSTKSDLGINHGLCVIEVGEGVFKQRGITDGFIILSVNHQNVNSEKDLDKALGNVRNGKVRVEGVNSTGTYNITFEFYR